jgi:gas vesicle protein
MDRNSTGIVKTGLGGLFMGLVAGLVAGLLFAPRSGSETRKILRDGAFDVLSSTQGKVRTFGQAIDDKTEGIRKNVTALTEVSDQAESLKKLEKKVAALEKKTK